MLEFFSVRAMAAAVETVMPTKAEETKAVMPPKAEVSIKDLLHQVKEWFHGVVRCADRTVPHTLTRIDWDCYPLKTWKDCFMGSVAELDKGFQRSVVASKHYLKLLQRSKEVPAGDLAEAAKLNMDSTEALDEAVKRCWDFYYDIQCFEEHRLLYPDHLELAPGIKKLRHIRKLVRDHLTELKKNAAVPPSEGGARAGAGGP